jgi:hypothetical protein
MPLRSALCALALLTVCAPASGAYRHRDRCNLPDVRTVALTAQLRVFQDGGFGYYYGCERRTGRRTLLWEQDDLYVAGEVMAVAGPFVAYRFSTTPGCKADCPPDVHGSSLTAVTDVRTGRRRELTGEHVYRLLLRPSGTVAWVSGVRPDSLLSMWAPGGPSELLDEGDIHAVRREKSLLTWANGDGPHSVPFP